MTHRGSWTARVGDPIYLIETTRQYESKPPQIATKVFTSESGFKAGLRAVKDDIEHAKRLNARSHLGWAEETITFRTFICERPSWEEHTP